MLKPSEEAGVGARSSWEDRTAIRQVMFVKILNKMLLHVNIVMELFPSLIYFLTFFCLSDLEKLSLISILSLANSNAIN